MELPETQWIWTGPNANLPALQSAFRPSVDGRGFWTVGACGGEKRVAPAHAALEYRWWMPATRESATTRPLPGGSTARETGASPSSVMWGRSSL